MSVVQNSNAPALDARAVIFIVRAAVRVLRYALWPPSGHCTSFPRSAFTLITLFQRPDLLLCGVVARLLAVSTRFHQTRRQDRNANDDESKAA